LYRVCVSFIGVVWFVSHLQAGVHLEEVEVLVVIDDELRVRKRNETAAATFLVEFSPCLSRACLGKIYMIIVLSLIRNDDLS
jgi:hypothetical protein